MSAGVGIFVHIINYAIRNGNTVLENYLKTCSKSETSLSKYPRWSTEILLPGCYERSFKRSESYQDIFPLILDEASDALNKKQLSFCLRFADSINDVRKKCLKFVHCDEGVTNRDLFDAVTNTLPGFGFELMNCRGQGGNGTGGIAGKVSGLLGIGLQNNNLALYTRFKFSFKSYRL